VAELLVNGAIDFFGRRVLVTGDTGFKGAWLCRLLHRLGAEVIGVGLPLETEPWLFERINGPSFVTHFEMDIRDTNGMSRIVTDHKPDFVVHMAAQALVRRSYRQPTETFSTNVMGTISVLQALFDSGVKPAATLVVTSDKVYRNDGLGASFIEDMPLGGEDPYSASKAATEHAVTAMRATQPNFGAIATARAGNVVGGGDWAEDRLIPDFYRAVVANRVVELRYPNAVRPWQFVLDVLSGYLEYSVALAGQRDNCPLAMNFGPSVDTSLPTVREVVETLGAAMLGNRNVWTLDEGEHLPEQSLLRLNTDLAKSVLGWFPRLDQVETIDWTVAWYDAFNRGRSAAELMDDQIERYLDTKWFPN
jgi:CDP-glucose 4,6-dehydratase